MSTSRLATTCLLIRQANMLRTKRNRSSSQGFTLIELMIVVAIVGMLSAVALPRFLGMKDKATLNTQLGEAAGLAKECAATILADGPYPADYPTSGGKTNSGLYISRNCNGGSQSKAPTGWMEYRTEAANKNNAGIKCGQTELTSGKYCRIWVDFTNGEIAYSVK